MSDSTHYDKQVEDGCMVLLTYLLIGVFIALAAVILATGGPITVTGVLGSDNDVRITVFEDDRTCAQLLGYQPCDFDGVQMPQE